MIRLRRIRSMIHSFFLKHYNLIIAPSITLAATTGFFHIQWKYQNRDFIFWINTVIELYKQYECLFLTTVAAVVVIKVLIAVFLFAINASPMNWFDDLTRLEVEKRYSDFLFMRLVSDISNIKERELKDKTIVSMASFIKAHEDIQEKIAKFRKDARKLFTPNEIEISLPVEEVYDTESEVIDKKFQHINLGEQAVRKLITS